MDMMRSMMAYADLQIVFWGKALSTVAYILNRVKTKSKPLTPFEIWTGHQPDMTQKSEESDSHALDDFSDKDLENSGRKRTNPEPVMQSKDADDSVDFVDTYSPVAKFASVRIIMVVAARLDLELHQLDVKTTFLNGDLKEEIYMDQPDGFQIKGQEGKAILDIGYEMSPLDNCVYVWRDKEKLALLSLYVDDILLASNSPDMMKETKFCLGSMFEMKDMGLANYVLGMIVVSYAQVVGSLMYAMTSTRPDICYAVGLLCFGLDELEIKGFTDADFAGDTDDRKSTSGYVFLFGGTAVSWLSKKQGCVAKDTMEAEYIACSTTVSNAV
uniref:Reverse transcriptase Ty1/copia-type domain-containing protein n=1 Tax=Fagus sylvatica TaxID=28930 RepID=A0A2N9FQW9_FAGSY